MRAKESAWVRTEPVLQADTANGTRLTMEDSCERDKAIEELAQVKFNTVAVECCFTVATSNVDRSESNRPPLCHFR